MGSRKLSPSAAPDASTAASSDQASPVKSPMVVYTLRAPKDEIDRFRGLAADAGVTASEWVRQAVRTHESNDTPTHVGELTSALSSHESEAAPAARGSDLHLRLSAHVRAAVAEAADRDGASMNAWVRECIHDRLSVEPGSRAPRIERNPAVPDEQPVTTQAGGTAARLAATSDGLYAVLARLAATAAGLDEVLAYLAAVVDELGGRK